MRALIAAVILVFMMGSFPFTAVAEEFDPNFVLSDRDITDTSIPDDYAQRFLESKGSGIANTRFPDIDGTMKTPGDLITYYGRIYGVNPRYLLTLIQKEQSLVTDPDPSTCQIDWATGYGRPDGSTCSDPEWQRYRGFTSQIVNAAAFARYFYENQDRDFGYFQGQTAFIDGSAVVPANTATAMLYSYTPHLHGNRLLLGIWSQWFVSSYPDGSYLRGPDGKTWVIQAGVRRGFETLSALYSRVDESRIIDVGPDILAQYEVGTPIRFADYSLVRVPDGTVYMLVRDVKRPVASAEVFRTIGFNPEEILDVSEGDLTGYMSGDPITLKSSYPTGALLQDDATGGVYWVQDGVKHAIWSPEIMRVNWPQRSVSQVSKEELDRFPAGDPARFRDGELVTCSGCQKAVYVISNGRRRPIVSGEVFEALGYDWRRVVHTTNEAVFRHPLGELVTLEESGASEVSAALAR